MKRRIKFKIEFNKTEHKEYAILFVILLTGAFFRFKGLNSESLWLDELLAVTRTAPHLSFSEITAIFQTDPHPPLFFLTLHYWMSIFGYNEVAARVLVAVIGSLSVISVYFLGKECLNKKTGLMASLFVSINYFNIYFSQEVRPYILLFLFTTLSYTFFLKLIREQTRKNIISYALLTAAMMYSHYYGLIHLLAQLIFLMLYLVFEKGDFEIKKFRRNILKSFSLSGIIIVLLYSPWLPALFKLMGKSKHWTKKPDPSFFITLINDFFASEPYLVALFSGFILVLLLYYILVVSNNQANTQAQYRSAFFSGERGEERLNLSIPVLFSWIFFTLFIPYYRSMVATPMYCSKYAIGTLPVILVVGAISISSFRNPTFRALLIISVVLVSLVSLFHTVDYYGKHEKQNWREVASFVAHKTHKRYPGKEIYLIARYPSLHRFYFQSLGRDIQVKQNLPTRHPKLFKKVVKRILKRARKQNKDIGIWLMPEHGFRLPTESMAYLNAHFRALKRKQFKAGEAILFEPVKKSPPPLHAKF